MAEASPNAEFRTTDSKAPIGRALYRQALRWCKDNEMTKAPISHLIPVQIFSTPVIEESSLQRLYHGDETDIQKLMPRGSIVKEDKIFVSFETISEIRDFWKAIFRMNIHPRDGDVQRVRISAAFSSMRGLNTLTQKINEIEKSRESHRDREGVSFQIGQVVRHMRDNWRGIILGWEKGRMNSDDERKSSLTSKSYLVDNNPEDGDESEIIWYKIIPDVGDLSLSPAGTIRRYGNLMTGLDDSNGLRVAMELQNNLELVDDVALCRVTTKETSLFFERFDSQTKRFIPNQTILYEYPLDYLNAMESEDHSENSNGRMGENVTNVVQAMARRLELKLLESRNRMTESHSALLDDFHVDLSRLARGDIFNEFEILKTKKTPEQVATRHLNKLCQFSTTISEFLALRRCAIESRDLIQYNLGDIVQHKVYGFRGVVVGWDPKPVMDVSNWDGLADIENPNEKPFLHIRTDTRDCEEAFGSERPFRYVCQENLEPCPRHRTLIDPDLNWKKDEIEARYIAPDHMKFTHGEDLKDQNLTEICLFDLYTDFNAFLLRQREVVNDGNIDSDDSEGALSIQELLSLLKSADNLEAANALAMCIKSSWNAHPNPSLKLMLDIGTTHLASKNFVKALDILEKLVNGDPNYGEAWSKLSACYLILNQKNSSLDAANKALELIPQHLQALSVVAVLEMEAQQYQLGSTIIRKVLSLDPWSTLSTKLVISNEAAVKEDVDDE